MERKHRLPIYHGITDLYCYPKFFLKGNWESENELVLAGKENVVETHILLREHKVEYVNLTPYEQPPIFQMMRTDVSNEGKEKAYKDWLHSLPPAIAAIVTYESN